MRLIKDTNPGAYAVRVRCIGTDHKLVNRWGNMPLLADAYADLDGVPFVSYYCDQCVTSDPAKQASIISREEI